MLNLPHSLLFLLNGFFRIDPKKVKETSEFPLNYYLLFVIIVIITIVIIKKRNN